MFHTKTKLVLGLFFFGLLFQSSFGWTGQQSRRDIFKKTVITTSATFSFAVAPSSPLIQDANALDQCRAKARNCIRTTWAAPNNIDKEQAITAIKDALNSYPQKGQNGIDCNGWSIVRDTLSSEDGVANFIALEFKSCVGPSALAINLAQPFIDDVILELSDVTTGEGKSIAVEVKSSSRMGASDLSVNKKRIENLGNKLRQQGWIVPDVKYGA